MKHYFIITILLAASAIASWADDKSDSTAVNDDHGVSITGSVESEWLIPQSDKRIDFEPGDDKVMTNTYADIELSSKWVDAGARFEFLQHPLPGFESGFKGWGVPHVWVKGKLNRVEVTAGNVYEQFGSGFVLHTYEERTLGLDNSLLGGRVVYRPVDGVTFKALAGAQRRYWHYNRALVSGADASVSLEQWLKSLATHGGHLELGLSWVGKHEGDDVIMADATHRLNLPHWAHAWDVRAQWQQHGVDLLLEWAHKGDNPSQDNGYTHGSGNAVMLSAAYAKKGLDLLVRAKRSENMSFRSKRTVSGISSMISHQPAFTMEHDYDLAGFYPYATRQQGEWAYQARAAYTFEEGTAPGGRYGTTLKVNFSHIHSLPGSDLTPEAGSNAKKTAFWKWGNETYYQEFNVGLEKKISNSVSLNLLYINQRYNQTILDGEGGIVRANIFVADCSYDISPKVTLRAEAQYLATRDDEGDWTFGLLELSLPPHWMITVSDEWNNGDSNIHYYQALLAYTNGAHCIQGGYGRVSSGFECVAGVRRYAPATRGFTLSYSYEF